jgi:hypothetical protein
MKIQTNLTRRGSGGRRQSLLITQTTLAITKLPDIETEAQPLGLDDAEDITKWLSPEFKFVPLPKGS